MKINLTQTLKNCDKTIFENGVARLELTDREFRKNLADAESIEINLVSFKKSKEVSNGFFSNFKNWLLSKISFKE